MLVFTFFATIFAYAFDHPVVSITVVVAICLFPIMRKAIYNSNRSPSDASVRRPVDGRRINGHPLRTNEDWDRWWVKKGFSDGIFRHLAELERDIVSISSDHASASLTEWHHYYEKYRNVCLECGIWNLLIGDRQPFIASADQLSSEESIIHNLSLRYNAAEEAREAQRQEELSEQVYRDAILDFIKKQPGHIAKRYYLLQDVSFQNEIPIEQLRVIYKKMLKSGDLVEKKEDRHYIVKKARKLQGKNAGKASSINLPPSLYNPAYYSLVDRKTLYKVEYTVGSVQNLDREGNRGEFVSLSSGDLYHTSLSKCTCPAYSDSRHPCKHMVALAIALGYLDPKTIK